MTLRIGFVGAGYIARVHATILKADPRVQIAAVTDLLPAAAADFHAAFGAAVHESVDALLGAVDAVYVTTPNVAHRDPVVKALRQGIHVFCEKPMATTLAEAAEIREAAEGARCLYQLGFNRRFAPVYQQARSLIDSGALSPRLAHMKMNRGELQHPPWVGNPERTGGFLYETTIHLLDMARFLMGPVAAVQCKGRANIYREMDDFAMLLTFESGAMATFASSAHATWWSPFERVELFGDHACLETQEMRQISYTLGLGQPVQMQDFTPLVQARQWGYAEEDDRFVTAVLAGGPSPVGPADAYRAVELVEACYHSARSGAEVALPLT